MSAPTGVIEIVHYENGHKFMAERLDPPVVRGASERHYRLWEDGVPAIGRQYSYDREDAARSIVEMCETHAYQTIERLKTRIRLLENSLRLANQIIDQGHADKEIGTEVLMFEIQQHAELWHTSGARLTHNWQTPRDDEQVKAQAKKIRVLINARKEIKVRTPMQIYMFNHASKIMVRVDQGYLLFDSHPILKDTMQRVVQTMQSTEVEINDDVTRNELVAGLQRHLDNRVAQRHLMQAKVVCDTSNNPHSVLKRNQIIATVSVQDLDREFYTLSFSNRPFEDWS